MKTQNTGREAGKEDLALRLKNGFISTVSHELMTPLAVIKEAVSLLLDGFGGKLARKQRRFLVMARENVDRACNMIHDLRSVSQSELTQPELRRREVDLCHLVSRTVEEMRPQTARLNVKLSDKSPRRVVYVLCDEVRIRKVLTIFLEECLRFSSEGDAISVDISLMSGEAHVSVVWAKNEPASTGPAKTARTKKTRRSSKQMEPAAAGSSLDFKLGRALIEVHGGRLRVEEKKGESIHLSFTLPPFDVYTVPPQLVREMVAKADSKRDACSVFVVKVDRYNEMASSCGARAARKMLLGIGSLLRQMLRPATDAVIQFGEDSYLVLLESTYPSGRSAVMRRMDTVLRRYQCRLDKAWQRFSILRGFASYPEQASGPLTLLEKAMETLEPVTSPLDTVLVLGGDETGQMMLRKTIEAKGYHSLLRSTQEAFSMMQKIKPWLVLINMENDEDFAHMQKLKAAGGDCIIIATTRRAQTRLIVRSIQAGAYDYIKMPCSMRTVEKLLHSARQLYLGEDHFVADDTTASEKAA